MSKQLWQRGDKLKTVTKGPVTQVDLVRYAGASGDFNPIHFDDVAAKQAGLDGVIAHGMLTMAYVGQLLNEFASDNALLKEFSVRFRAMVKPGDTIICSGEVIRVEPLDSEDIQVTVSVLAETDTSQTAIKGTAILLFYAK